MGFSVSADCVAAIQAHALGEYPKESCGLIDADGGYIPVKNLAENPNEAFEMSGNILALHPGAVAVVHSHPDGTDAPSSLDMESQMGTGLIYGLLSVSRHGASVPWFWGPGIRPALIGREFRHGPSGTDNRGDCYALIRDWFAEIRGEEIPEFPRNDSWWDQNGNLYAEGFASAGFAEVTNNESPQEGDVFFLKINAPVPNHAGIYIGNGLILHHLAGRLSRREPVGRWMKHLERWVRRDAA